MVAIHPPVKNGWSSCDKFYKVIIKTTALENTKGYGQLIKYSNGVLTIESLFWKWITYIRIYKYKYNNGTHDKN